MLAIGKQLDLKLTNDTKEEHLRTYVIDSTTDSITTLIDLSVDIDLTKKLKSYYLDNKCHSGFELLASGPKGELLVNKIRTNFDGENYFHFSSAKELCDKKFTRKILFITQREGILTLKPIINYYVQSVKKKTKVLYLKDEKEIYVDYNMAGFTCESSHNSEIETYDSISRIIDDGS